LNDDLFESLYHDSALHILTLRTAALIGFGCSAEVLGQILDTSLGAVALGAGRVNRDKLTLGDTAADVEDVFDLVELTTSARKNRSGSELLLECAGDLGIGVGLAGAGGDTSTSKPVVGGQVFEEGDGGVEEVHKLVFLLVVGVAIGVQRGVTCSVLAPFVLPDQWLVV
jgi:hypothetical protein